MDDRQGRFWKLIADGAWLWITVGIAIHAFFFTQAHNLYLIYAPAIRLWWVSEDIYVLQLDYFRYSPLFAVLLSPLVFLPDSWGSMIWKSVNIAIYYIGLKSAWKHLSPSGHNPKQEAAFLLLSLPGSLHSMANGQANCCMVGFLLWALSLIARHRWLAASMFLALAAMVKSYALALGLLVAAWKPQEIGPRLGLGLALCLAFPFLTQTPAYVADEYLSWVHHLRESTNINRDRQRAFDQLMWLAGQPIDANTFTLLGMMAGAGVLAWAWHQHRMASSFSSPDGVKAESNGNLGLIRTYQGFAVWVALFGPATESCTYIIIAPAVALSCVEAQQQVAAWWWRLLLFISLFLMGPAATDVVGPMRAYCDTHGVQPIGALLYTVLLIGGSIIRPVRLFPDRGRSVNATAAHEVSLVDCRCDQAKQAS